MFLEVLYNLIIAPLETVFEVVFYFGYSMFTDAGIAILGLSLVMNFLVLPLYKRADALQEEERDKTVSMKPMVDHIKKTFKGDERYMMLNEYYRTQNYKPIYALKSSFSLLLQIPFFIAAYHYLSNLAMLNGMSFLFLSDLGAPDQLIQIGTITINLMPIIMTALNFASAFIYLRGFPLKDKIQTYGIAVIFLVLLYNSPSGLVIYWTLNQIFSTLKNVFMKLVKSRKVLNIVFSSLGVAIFILFICTGAMSSKLKIAFAVLILILCQIPSIASLVKKLNEGKVKEFKPLDTRLFLLGAFAISVVIGMVIPLSVISASPIEFVSQSNNPLHIIVINFSITLGFFLVWGGIYYYLLKPKARNFMVYLYWFIAIVAIVDFLFFGRDLGTMSVYLVYDNGMHFSGTDKLINLVIVAAIVVGLFFIMKYLNKYITYVYIALIIGAVAIVAINGSKTHSTIVEAQLVQEENGSTGEDIIHLSKNGKNVVFIMLDRAISPYVQFIFDEKPEILEQFDGFTYYPNTLSYARTTNFCVPALYAGYEYSPVEINKRADETLADKHNEALKVLPVLFDENDYEVTVCDPPYAGYTSPPDLTIYRDHEDIRTFNTIGNMSGDYVAQYSDYYKKLQTRNFFFYSIMKAVPVAVQGVVYNGSNYYSTAELGGGSETFLNSYSVLCALNDITTISEGAENTFLMLENDTTHEPTLLSTPTYEPGEVNEDTLYEKDGYTLNGMTINMKDTNQVSHYHVNMAAFIKIGEWLDYLREQGVYDNTKIVIVSDHGRSLAQFDNLVFGEIDVEGYNSLLMVKDFGQSGDLEVIDEFMVTADVPTILTDDAIENPVNPYTGNAINSNAKTAEDIFVTPSWSWDIKDNDGYLLNTQGTNWYKVKDNIFDQSNWILIGPDLGGNAN